MSPVFDCSDDEGRAGAVTAAADSVRRGGLVVLPTDTVYGVGADAFDGRAVGALLEAKGRGRDMPPPVLVASPDTVDGLATDVPAYARTLIERYWPGPLTLIFKAQPSLAWDLGDTNGTVAVRMPDHPVALALLAETGPLAVTSANRTGQPAATGILEAATMLGAAVEVYLDDGPSPTTVASTIVDCTHDEPLVLRPGVITAAQVRQVYLETRPVADAVGEEASEPGESAVHDASGTDENRR